MLYTRSWLPRPTISADRTTSRCTASKVRVALRLPDRATTVNSPGTSATMRPRSIWPGAGGAMTPTAGTYEWVHSTGASAMTSPRASRTTAPKVCTSPVRTGPSAPPTISSEAPVNSRTSWSTPPTTPSKAASTRTGPVASACT